MNGNKTPNKLSKREREELAAVSEELHKKDGAYQKRANFEFFIYLVVTFLAVFALRQYVGEPVRVDGPSMNNTLLNDERMIVEKISYLFRAPKRGEIITCYYPGYDVSCVKRVIGLPGETVEIIHGVTYIDGEPLDESEWIAEPMWDYSFEAVTVPENCVFVMGDNRNYSKDSRDETVGCIPFQRIVGHAAAVIWPLDKIRGLG